MPDWAKELWRVRLSLQEFLVLMAAVILMPEGPWYREFGTILLVLVFAQLRARP